MGRIPRIIIASAVLAVVVAIFTVAIMYKPNRVVIRNDGSSDIGDIQLTLHDLDGRVVLREGVSRLKPGESVTFQHDANDSRADIRFVVAGQAFAYHEHYIDLWTGEGWTFAIDASGEVQSGYESTMVVTTTP